MAKTKKTQEKILSSGYETSQPGHVTTSLLLVMIQTEHSVTPSHRHSPTVMPFIHSVNTKTL